jgi:DNA-binding XRE family transcriptional regulator
MSTCISRFANLGKGDSTHSYSPARDEGHVDPGEFAANHLYLIEDGEVDVDLPEALYGLDGLEVEDEADRFSDEAMEILNPTLMSRVDRELFYDPPIRSDIEVAAENRKAWYTQRGRVCLYPDCESKVRYTKKVSFCERHQDSEDARYTNPGEFYESSSINPRVYGLSTVRRDRGLTQKGLSELSGLSTRRIEKFESGERGPSLDERCVLAEILGTTESTLLLHPERGVM